MNHERAPQTPERATEKAASPERRSDLEQRTEQLEREGNKQVEKQAEQAESARHQIEELPDQQETTPNVSNDSYSPFARAETKRQSYKRTLKHLQTKLPTKRSRAFSKFIHQPTIESASDFASKTVFRPSVTLGASLGALLGGSIIYFAAQHYGFTLSGTEFLLFGVVGAGLGIIAELLFVIGRRLFKRR